MTKLQQRHIDNKAANEQLEKDIKADLEKFSKEKDLGIEVEFANGIYCSFSVGMKSYTSYSFEDELNEKNICPKLDFDNMTIDDITKLIDSNKDSIRAAHEFHKYLKLFIF